MNNTSLIDLSKNENSFGPNPHVVTALMNIVEKISLYPCMSGHKLKEILGEFHNIQPEQIVIGNGSVSILDHCARAILSPGDEAIIPRSTFIAIPQIVRDHGAHVIDIPLSNWMIDLQRCLSLIGPRTRLIILVNPNNPTGTCLPQETIINFLQHVPPHINVVVDEAYIDYIQDPSAASVADLINEFDNLSVTRTFSKAHGLAALRIGYSIMPQPVAKRINAFQLPFSNNSLALEAAALSIQDSDYLKRVRIHNKSGQEQLCSAFREMGINYIDSVANFISIKLGADTKMVFDYLKARRILVAPQASVNMPDYLRVTIGAEEQNSIFLNYMREYIISSTEGIPAYEAV